MPYAAIVGQPVEHSLSPVLHRAAYDSLGLTDWSYRRIECSESDFPALVRALDGDCRGLSVTMPDKRVALRCADPASDLAVAVGAANTLVRSGAGWYADNTDVAGIVGALREVGVSNAAAGAVVLGAGGTAAAALAALAQLGERSPTVLVRSVSRAADLLAAAGRLRCAPQVVDGLAPAIDGALPGAEQVRSAPIVISTLPRGAADGLAAGRWNGSGVLLDAIYDPWPTPLAAAARAAGWRIASGRDLLVHQAVDQVELITGRRPGLSVLRAALPA